MSTVATNPATRVLEQILAVLAIEEIDVTRDAGAFYPQPVGVLVGLPALASRGQYFRTYEVSVLVVSGDPLNNSPAVDRLTHLADQVAAVLATNTWRVSSWRGSPNAEPLPALELTVTVTTTEEEET